MTALPSTEDLARLAKAITPGPWRTAGGSICAAGVTDTYSGTVWGSIATTYDLSQQDFEGRTWSSSGDPSANARAIALLPVLLREVLDRREANAWSPATNILPWCALTIDQMRTFESSTGEIQRMGLNGEWIATDTPLSPGLIYRIKTTTTPTTEASHGE